jgi:hypothetical protein
MIDPKDAGKIGESYGKAVTDAVFGIVDVIKAAPGKNAANNQRIANRNKITEINNQIIRQNNALHEQAMREIAAEQEANAVSRMSPAQRKTYKETKAAQEKAAQRAKLMAERSHEQTMEYIMAFCILFVVVPLMIFVGLLFWGMADVRACYSMKDYVPLMKAVCAR